LRIGYFSGQGIFGVRGILQNIEKYRSKNMYDDNTRNNAGESNPASQ
jgi:hypothetical protein